MRCVLGVIILLNMWALQAAAQPPRACGGLPQINIRQNTRTRTEVAAPAFITWSNPDNGPTVAQAGIAVLLECDVRDGLVVAPYVEYLRNDIASQPQDVFRAGGQFEWILRPEQGPSVNVGAIGGSRHHSGVVVGNVDFKRDAVKGTKSVVSSARYTHFFNGDNPWRPHRATRFAGGALELLYGPYLGFEAENILQSDVASREGSVGRVVAEIRTMLYPAPSRLQGKVEFILAIAYRRDLWDSTDASDATHPFGTAEANVFPIRTDKAAVGFGVTFKNGDNPDEGFASQRLWQFSVKIRLQ
jgi:hypothetical protein